MANRLNLNLDEWKADLAAEPVTLATAAAPPVQTAAGAGAAELRDAYPAGPTGNLRRGVRVDQDDTADNPAIASAVVVSGAPHAHLYEDGTRYARARPTFYPITNRHGRGMTDQVNTIVEARGYTVTGAID